MTLDPGPDCIATVMRGIDWVMSMVAGAQAPQLCIVLIAACNCFITDVRPVHHSLQLHTGPASLIEDQPFSGHEHALF